ncbi:SET domain-containing protein [Lophiostoma macrostomum CBS 122681]|uniref:SET domain-containing protein n=1 Tax=Lophiostoma macrostomum CBS 122681 TaxID=1314788 RepID=A0A6A6SW15_9PLEO|nr:SET domain-containing protein [Lophiostoma macrostomum CBS 122681]
MLGTFVLFLLCILDAAAFSVSGPPEVYTVRSSPGKGFGVFAAVALEPGSIIMRETPVIKITPPPLHEGFGHAMREVGVLVREVFETLPKDSQAEIMSLHAYSTTTEQERPDYDELVPIFRCNAYYSGNEIGLFPKIARINHSCRPNTSYFWNEQLNRRIVYATRPIGVGEEIFVSYIPLLQTSTERQKRLDQYGFKCTCAACAADTHSQKSSDRRRVEIRQSINILEEHSAIDVPGIVAGKRKLQILASESRQLVDAVEEEEVADYYSQCYRLAAIFHANIQDWEAASMWARKSYHLKMMADATSPGTKEMELLTTLILATWEKEVKENATSQVWH